MPSTVIVEARKFARDGLAALLTENVSVTYAWDPKSTEMYQIFTMRCRGEHEPASLKSGRTFRNETARFDIGIHVAEIGGNVEDADEKAIEFGQVLEEFIADNRCPAVDGVNWWVVESWELNGGPSDRAAISQLIYTVKLDARLT